MNHLKFRELVHVHGALDTYLLVNFVVRYGVTRDKQKRAFVLQQVLVLTMLVTLLFTSYDMFYV